MKKITKILKWASLTIVLILIAFITYISIFESEETPPGEIAFITKRNIIATPKLISSSPVNYLCTRFKLVDDYLFLWNYSQRKVEVRDANGIIINEIGQSGNGPSDFERVIDFSLNKEQSVFEFIDTGNGAIKKFSELDGTFIESSKIKINLDKVVEIGDTKKYFVTTWRAKNTLDFKIIDIYSDSIVNSDLEINQYFHDVPNSAMIHEGFFARNDCGKYFYASYQNPFFYSFDEKGNVIYSVKTIYDFPEPEIIQGKGFTAPGKSYEHLTSVYADCSYVYILSNIANKNGERVIDVYYSESGKYKGSMALPNFGDEKPTDIIVRGNTIYSLYENSLKMFSHDL